MKASFDQAIEEWRSVDGLDSSYQISNIGRLRRKAGYVNGRFCKRLRKQKILKSHISQNGYCRIAVTNGDGTNQNLSIHRLVAVAFIPNQENKPCINHKNAIKTDNRVENIEWCTYSENSHHAIDNKLYVTAKPQLGKPGILHPRSKPVIQYKNGIKINRFESACIASNILGIKQGQISRVCRGERKQTLGFVFRYDISVKEEAKSMFKKIAVC